MSSVDVVWDGVEGIGHCEANDCVGGVVRFHCKLCVAAQVVVLEDAVGFAVVGGVPAGVKR